MPTTNLKIDFVSTQQSQKEVTLNVAIQTLDTAVAGRLVKDLTPAVAALALTAAECANPYLMFTGIPTNAKEITVVARPWLWVVDNAATGANAALTMKTPAGAALSIAAGSKALVFCSGAELGLMSGQSADLSGLQSSTYGHLTKDLTSSGASTVLTSAEALNAFLSLTGTPVAGTAVVLPQTPRFWVIDSTTAGANATVTLKTAAGDTLSIAPGQVLGIYCNGTTVAVLSDLTNLTALTARVAALESAGGTGGSGTTQGGHLTKSLTGLASPVTLSAAEAANSLLTFTGGQAGPMTVIVPSASGSWTFENKTGNVQLTVKTAAGTGIYLPQNGAEGVYTIQAYCDGTNVKPLASNRTLFHSHFPGKPAAGQLVMGYLSVGKTMLPSNAKNHVRFGVMPAASQTLYLRKVVNGGAMPGAIVLSASFYAGLNSYYFTANQGDVTLNDGDFLYFEAPATPDTAMSDIFMTLNLVRLE